MYPLPKLIWVCDGLCQKLIYCLALERERKQKLSSAMECIQLVCLDTAEPLFTNESLKVQKTSSEESESCVHFKRVLPGSECPGQRPTLAGCLLSADKSWSKRRYSVLTFKCDGFQVLQEDAAVRGQHPGTDAKSVVSTELSVHWLDGIGKGKHGVADKLKLSLRLVAVIRCHSLLAGTVSREKGGQKERDGTGRKGKERKAEMRNKTVDSAQWDKQLSCCILLPPQAPLLAASFTW